MTSANLEFIVLHQIWNQSKHWSITHLSPTPPTRTTSPTTMIWYKPIWTHAQKPEITPSYPDLTTLVTLQPQTSTTTTIKPPHSTLNVNRTIQEKGKKTVIIIEDRFSVHSPHVNSVIKNHKQYPTANRSQFPAQALPHQNPHTPTVSQHSNCTKPPWPVHQIHPIEASWAQLWKPHQETQAAIPKW